MSGELIDYKEEYWSNGNRKLLKKYYSNMTTIYFNYNSDGQLESKVWVKDSHIQRDDGPSYIEYHDNGDIRKLIYFDGSSRKINREDGPALIEFDKIQKLKSLEWYVNGVRHREDGPAIIRYRNFSDKVTEMYYIDGIYCSRKDVEDAKNFFGTNPHYSILHIHDDDHVMKWFARKHLNHK